MHRTISFPRLHGGGAGVLLRGSVPNSGGELRCVFFDTEAGGKFVLVLEWSKEMPNIARIEPLP